MITEGQLAYVLYVWEGTLTGLYFAVKCPLQSSYKIHLESIRISDHFRINWGTWSAKYKARGIEKLTKYLVWYAEAIAEPILLHELPVLFGSFTPHFQCVMFLPS